VKEGDPQLHYRANDSPKWSVAVLFGAQQMMCCISGLLVMPFVVADLMCAGSGSVALRVRLISTAFVVCGIATLLQTTLGLRLAILQGPSFAFLPPLIAFSSLPENACNATDKDFVPEEQWIHRMLTVQGSLFVASLSIVFLGATGFVGRIAKFLGPITICPILTLLTVSTIEVILSKISDHWISIVQISTLLVVAVYFADVSVPIPVIDIKHRRVTMSKARVFGLFPYLISVGLVWLICCLLTWTNLEPDEGKARVDKNQTMIILYNSPWLSVPYPGQFGMPRISLGLSFGFLASCVACVIETLGSYATIARVSQEPTAPSSTVNRAILIEGVGCCLAALMGISVGVTTFSENVALVSVTKVASRLTMQLAGCMLIILGIFSKVGAILATIPSPCIGAVLLVGMSMIFGVGLSCLQSVDLKISRNLTIMGFSVIVGLLIPHYFKLHPPHTGLVDVDHVLQTLLNIPMFVGGIIALILDNTVSGEILSCHLRRTAPLVSSHLIYSSIRTQLGHIVRIFQHSLENTLAEIVSLSYSPTFSTP
uniref:C-type lectin domain-containing protein n=1 Tax=Parascaris univalens TaxID=6257 RepID=A0A915BL48_PARUN